MHLLSIKINDIGQLDNSPNETAMQTISFGTREWRTNCCADGEKEDGDFYGQPFILRCQNINNFCCCYLFSVAVDNPGAALH